MSKLKKPPEAASGAYTPLPKILLESTAFMFASHSAKALLLELMFQHTGYNNGHLNLAMSKLRPRGWCVATMMRARNELLERNLIVQTKRGGLNLGPDLFALTWHNISNFVGLDIGPAEYHRGAWSIPATKPSSTRGRPVIKKICHSEDESSTAIKTRAAKSAPTLKTSAIKHKKTASAALITSDILLNHYPLPVSPPSSSCSPSQQASTGKRAGNRTTTTKHGGRRVRA